MSNEITTLTSVSDAPASPLIVQLEGWQTAKSPPAPELPTAERDSNRKAGILARLHRLGIQELVVSYSGNCDDGSITEMEVTDPEELRDLLQSAYGGDSRGDQSVEPLRELSKDIETFCTDELEERVLGWEDDEGGCGDFTFDVVAGTVTCSHWQHYIESDLEEWEV